MGVEREDDDGADLTAVLDEFVSDLTLYDQGLWELSWLAAGRFGRPAADFVEWSRASILRLDDAGRVRLWAETGPECSPSAALTKPTDKL